MQRYFYALFLIYAVYFVSHSNADAITSLLSSVNGIILRFLSSSKNVILLKFQSRMLTMQKNLSCKPMFHTALPTFITLMSLDTDEDPEMRLTEKLLANMTDNEIDTYIEVFFFNFYNLKLNLVNFYLIFKF